jgi:hypothetical protein
VGFIEENSAMSHEENSQVLIGEEFQKLYYVILSYTTAYWMRGL